MGSSSSYLKLKVNGHVASFIYEFHGNEYIQRTISCHPNDRFNLRKYRDYNYFYNFSGVNHYYDGDRENLNKILREFDPKKTDVSFLINRLRSECDLEEYKDLWTKINEWKDYVVSMPEYFLDTTWRGTVRLLGYYCDKE